MYYCNNCKIVFDEPAKIKEFIGEYWGSPAYQASLVCPFCAEGDYTEAHECPRREDDFFCKPCQDALLTLYKEVMDRFTVEEQTFLLEVGADALMGVER